MGVCGRIAAVFVVFIACITALFMSTKVPDGFQEDYWQVRTLLTFCRISDKIIKLSTLFGYEEVHTIKKAGDLFMDDSYNDNDTHVTQMNSEMDGIPVRLYWPTERTNDDNMPGVIFLHGGGWVLGSPASFSDVTYQLSKQLGAFVVSVDYRLAPEHLFPAGFEDCYKAAKYFLQNVRTYGVDPNRIAIKGDSSGGNLAAAVALRLRDENVQPKLKLQVLVYPVLQGTDFNTPSMQFNKDGPLTTQDGEVFFWNIYFYGHNKYLLKKISNNHTSPEYKKGLAKTNMDRSYLPDDEILKSYVPLKDNFGDEDFWNEHKHFYLNSYAQPLNAQKFADLPSAYISTCQNDVLRDDGYFYAGVLRKAGVKVTHENQKVCVHGWMSMLDLESSRTMLNEVISYMSNNL